MLVRKIEPIRGTPRIKIACDPVGNYGETVPTKFVLNETKYIILTWGVPLEGPLGETAENFLSKTIAYWRHWVQTTSIERFHQDAVIRSALTLKLHEYQDTGAIIAATTTSLPEFPGSTRNWDYRFCWMRDTHYTIKALNDFKRCEKFFAP